LLIQIISFNFADTKADPGPLTEGPSLTVHRGWVKFRNKPYPMHNIKAEGSATGRWPQTMPDALIVT